jgi:hypothetical protein
LRLTCGWGEVQRLESRVAELEAKRSLAQVAETSSPARLSTDGAGATPIWSPDGLKVAYSTFPEGRVLAREISGGRDGEELTRTPTFWLCCVPDLSHRARRRLDPPRRRRTPVSRS